MQIEKLAIIHPMRTGGTWLREQLAASTGLPLLCSWHQGLGRDWTRGELLDKLREPRGIVHNHVVNWDRELVEIAREKGWLTLMVVRNPVSQCQSLYAFLRDYFGCTGATVDQFFFAQAKGEFCWIDFRHWAVPSWWREVGLVLPYSRPPRLFGIVAGRLGLAMDAPPIAPRNEGRDHVAPGAAAREALERSFWMGRYQAAIANCKLQNAN